MQTGTLDLRAAAPPPPHSRSLQVSVLMKLAAALIALADRIDARTRAVAARPVTREVIAIDMNGVARRAVYDDGRLVGWIEGTGRL